MKKCPYCSTNMSDNANFCEKCGKAYIVLKLTKICPACFSESKEEALFCEICGYAFKRPDVITNPLPKNTLPETPTFKYPPPLLMQQQVTKKKTADSLGRQLLVIFGFIFLLILSLIFVSIINGTPSITRQVVSPTTQPVFETTVIPTLLPVPDFIVAQNNKEIEGVTIIVTKIERSLSLENDMNQKVDIHYQFESKNTYSAGFSFEAEELILDLPNNIKLEALSTSDKCLVTSNESCSAKAVFEIPVDVTQISLVYVSNRRMDNKRPINVSAPEERRYIASINLNMVYLSAPIFYNGSEFLDSDKYGVHFYSTIEDIIAARGEPQYKKNNGSDMNGVITNFFYSDYVYTLKNREVNGDLVYRVIKIEDLQTASTVPTPLKVPTIGLSTNSNTNPKFYMGLDSIDCDPYGIYIYTTVDDLLAIRGQPVSNKNIGEDIMGFIVKYYYSDLVYTIKYRKENGFSTYRVVEIQSR